MNKLLILVIPIFLSGQNVDMFFSLINEGQILGVREKVPELISKYPNDPGVLYLQAILTIEGNKALEFYGQIIERFPESKYSIESSVKIGEYFYAKGLYTQAAKQLCLIPRKYPRYPEIERIVDLMASSFMAIGADDSLRYYLGIYESMFPNLSFQNNFKREKVNKISKTELTTEVREVKPYVIQIGAFGSIQNAKRLKLQVSQIGYKVELVPVRTNGRSLNTVRIIRYKSKSEAERVGKLVKNKLGIEFRVLYRPKD